MSQSSFGRRLTTLIRKETHQLLRDKSNLAVGLLLPLLLILLFGYGLSFDLPNGRVAIVMEQRTPQVNTLLSGLQGSTYVVPTEYSSMAAAVQALRHNETDAILHIPPDFARQQSRGNGQLQLITNGAETSVASSIQAYVSGAIATASAIKVDRLGGGQARMGTVSIDQRLWFNESGNSTWFIVPGLVVLILTLIGAFLTGLLIARERERGTLEAIFVTPVRPIELVLAKLAPYMVIGCIDLLVCLLTSHFLFAVPIRGSLIAITLASLLYLVVSLSLGLTISGYAPGQFLASQVALIASFMPAMMLSGFVFDIRNLPVAIQVISQLLPATHFMSLIKALFLAGDDWPQFFKECGIMLGYALVLISASCFSLRKKLR
ncbi:ABC transporter permease [Rosenbergiella epipactidis]|uniref:ABC transporter permease n=1 Tax=Rosenbergiella epipactidis TaxID=1544694 RepID=UPI001F4E4ABB|nr:ABC transporter permease [Rosenbergiella epipactidis]